MDLLTWVIIESPIPQPKFRKIFASMMAGFPGNEVSKEVCQR